MDITGEDHVVAAALTSPECLAAGLEAGLKAEHFARAELGAVWGAMAALALARLEVGPASVQRSLPEGAPKLGLVDIVKMMTPLGGASTASPKATEENARAILLSYQRRELARTLAELSKEAAEAADVEGLRERGIQAVIAAGGSARQRRTFVDADTLATEHAHVLEQRRRSQRAPSLSCGIPVLDSASLFRPGTVVTLAARPGVGKSALAGSIALGAAEHGLRVAFVSLEMTQPQILDRFVASRAGVDTALLEHYWHADDDTYTNVLVALSQIAPLDLHVWCAEGEVTIDALRMALRRLHALRPIHLIVVDYVQLLGVPGSPSVYERTAAQSSAIRHLASETGAAVLSLAQLNRGIENRTERRYQLSDLKGAGELEADSHVVAFLDRPETYDDDAEPGRAVLAIAKNRNGRSGFDVVMHFNAASQRFCDPDDAKPTPPRGPRGEDPPPQDDRW